MTTLQGMLALEDEANRAVIALRSPNPAFAKVANTVRQSFADLIEGLVVAALSRQAAAPQGREALENCAGCIDAAEAEGLHEVLAEIQEREIYLEYACVERLVDLVTRRLMYARNYAHEALARQAQEPGEDKR